MTAIRSTIACMKRRDLLGGLGAAALAAAGPSFAQGFEVRPWRGARPSFDLRGIDGRTWRLDALRGRAVVLNFWATWCEPCRAEMPSLESLLLRQEAKGLDVLAVNFKEPAAVVRRFAQRLPLELPLLLDEDGSASRAFGVRVLPSTVLIDREGRGIAVVVGALEWDGEAARRLLEPLLAPQRT